MNIPEKVSPCVEETLLDFILCSVFVTMIARLHCIVCTLLGFSNVTCRGRYQTFCNWYRSQFIYMQHESPSNLTSLSLIGSLYCVVQKWPNFAQAPSMRYFQFKFMYVVCRSNNGQLFKISHFSKLVMGSELSSKFRRLKPVLRTINFTCTSSFNLY